MNTLQPALSSVLVEGAEQPVALVAGAVCFLPDVELLTTIQEDAAIPHKVLMGTLAGSIDPSTYMAFLIQSGIPVAELKPRMAYVLLRLGSPCIEISVDQG